MKLARGGQGLKEPPLLPHGNVRGLSSFWPPVCVDKKPDRACQTKCRPGLAFWDLHALGMQG